MVGYYLELYLDPEGLKLSYDSEESVIGTGACWTRKALQATRAAFREISGEIYLVGEKVGSGLETCYLSLAPSGSGDAPYRAVWHSCPVTPIDLVYPGSETAPVVPIDQPFQPWVTAWHEGERYFLARDEDRRAIFLPWSEVQCSSSQIRSTRHELMMKINLGQGRAEWVFRHHLGDPWKKGKLLRAKLLDELAFRVELEQDLDRDKICEVSFQVTSLDGSHDPAWYPLDLVSTGRSFNGSVFASQGTTCPPVAGPWRVGVAYRYTWGDTVRLSHEGAWEVQVTVGVEGYGSFVVDPQLCVGGGCEGCDEPEDCD